MTTGVHRIARSYLYVPGHREEVVAKALHTQIADAVVIDLEDAVPESSRPLARKIVRRLMAGPTPRPVWVRVNPVSTGATLEDLAAAASPHLAGIRLAKAESAADAAQVAEWLANHSCSAGVSCLIESASALERAYEIATAHPAVCGIALGEADLSADLGVDSEEGFLYARSRCVAVARAAGLPAPVQAVYTKLNDDDGLRHSCELGCRLGFVGRSAIHPRQLATINAVYSPSPEAVAQARSVIERWDDANEREAAVKTADGRFIDPAVVQSARRILALAEGMEVFS